MAAGAAAGSAFQFHKGTIKTDLSFTSKFTASVFQFHKGTIKTKYHDVRAVSST